MNGITDVRRMNNKGQNNKMNRILQAFMYKMLEDPNPTAAKKSFDVLVELYRRHVWYKFSAPLLF